MSEFIVDVNLQNFQQVVLEGSMKCPIVVDFWAPWCGPCKTLVPILEKLANEWKGGFVLAKVNADDNQEIAYQFGVRSIPSVKVVIQGQLADEFNGALPEAQVREFISRLVPPPENNLLEGALAAKAAGDLEAALHLLSRASAEIPGDEAVLLECADVLIALNRAEEARPILESLKEPKDKGRYDSLQARLAFAGMAGNLAELKATLDAKPDDGQAAIDYANALAAAGQVQEALEILFALFQRDRTFGEDGARKAMIKIFDMLGSDSDLMRQYRRKLSMALN